MQDRVSQYPGRVELTPVAGQTNIYDLTRADDPSVAGTPLNKATFLKDATVAAIAALGVSSPDTPDEALAGLANVLSGMNISGISHIEVGTYSGTGQYGSAHPTTLTFSIKPRLVLVGYGALISGRSDAAYLGFIWQYNKTGSVSNHTFSMPSDYSLEWYANTASNQSNTSGTTYYYVALGVQ